jgi:hypothetical protein
MVAVGKSVSRRFVVGLHDGVMADAVHRKRSARLNVVYVNVKRCVPNVLFEQNG